MHDASGVRDFLWLCSAKKQSIPSIEVFSVPLVTSEKCHHRRFGVSGRSPDWSFWNWRMRADGNDKTFPVRPAIDWQTEGSDWSWVSKGQRTFPYGWTSDPFSYPARLQFFPMVDTINKAAPIVCFSPIVISAQDN